MPTIPVPAYVVDGEQVKAEVKNRPTEDLYNNQMAMVTSVEDWLTAPPGGESEGDRYLVGASPTGAWAGHQYEIAYYDGTTWVFIDPEQGMNVFVRQKERLFRYSTNSIWNPVEAEDTVYLSTSGTPGGNWRTILYTLAFQGWKNFILGAGTFTLDADLDLSTFSDIHIRGVSKNATTIAMGTYKLTTSTGFRLSSLKVTSTRTTYAIDHDNGDLIFRDLEIDATGGAGILYITDDDGSPTAHVFVDIQRCDITFDFANAATAERAIEIIIGDNALPDKIVIENNHFVCNADDPTVKHIYGVIRITHSLYSSGAPLRTDMKVSICKNRIEYEPWYLSYNPGAASGFKYGVFYAISCVNISNVLISDNDFIGPRDNIGSDLDETSSCAVLIRRDDDLSGTMRNVQVEKNTYIGTMAWSSSYGLAEKLGKEAHGVICLISSSDDNSYDTRAVTIRDNKIKIIQDVIGYNNTDSAGYAGVITAGFTWFDNNEGDIYDISIENNTIDVSGVNSSTTTGYWAGISLCTFLNSQPTAKNISICKNKVWMNDNADAGRTYGIRAKAFGATNVFNVTITGNQVFNATYYGIRCDDLDQLVVSNNICEVNSDATNYCAHLISVENSYATVISGNHVYGDNRIDGTGIGSGFHVIGTGTSLVSVTGNTAQYCGGTAFTIVGGDCSCTGNVVMAGTNTVLGFYVSGDGHQIVSNTLYGSTYSQYAIQLTTTTDRCIVSLNNMWSDTSIDQGGATTPNQVINNFSNGVWKASGF